MKTDLNTTQLKYVFFHFEQSHDIDTMLQEKIVYCSKQEINQYQNRIVFLASNQPLHIPSVTRIEDVPILFPVQNTNTKYYWDQNGNLIFPDDLLKSAFYLLSGYQEHISDQKDVLNRFPYSESIQSKLNIIHKPVVNFYFHWIAQGLEAFAKRNSIPFLAAKKQQPCLFLLTHDVDRIQYYSMPRLQLMVKKILGLKQSDQSKLNLIRQLFKILLNLNSSRDPWWNFDEMLDIEEELGIKSIYFFLHKDVPHIDSYYTFKDSKIKALIRKIMERGHQIGLHGSVRSAYNLQLLQDQKHELEDVCGQAITKNRFHRLTCKITQSFQILEQAGFQEDYTLGFAAHEGFRNSYVHPFKLYDFEQEKMIDVWEFPLNVMDGTLFDYRKLSFERAQDSILDIVDDIKRFQGVFTLLWHNSYASEATKQGIVHFYTNALNKIKKSCLL